MKAELDQRETEDVAGSSKSPKTATPTGCAGLLAKNSSLVRAENPEAQRRGWNGLHTEAQGGHAAGVRVLLHHGANPNAPRPENTYPLHANSAPGVCQNLPRGDGAERILTRLPSKQ